MFRSFSPIYIFFSQTTSKKNRNLNCVKFDHQMVEIQNKSSTCWFCVFFLRKNNETRNLLQFKVKNSINLIFFKCSRYLCPYIFESSFVFKCVQRRILRFRLAMWLVVLDFHCHTCPSHPSLRL